MANLASSAVVQRDSFYTGGPSGKKYVAYVTTITLAAMGTATNKILASAFGLVTIAGCSCALKTDNSEVLPAVPSADGTYILLGGAALNAPADYTGDYQLTLWGSTV